VNQYVFMVRLVMDVKKIVNVILSIRNRVCILVGHVIAKQVRKHIL
jgi:hypothetical protein